MTIKENPRGGRRWWSQRNECMMDMLCQVTTFMQKRNRVISRFTQSLEKFQVQRVRKMFLQQAKENGSAEL